MTTVAAGLCATALAGALSVSSLQSASAAQPTHATPTAAKVAATAVVKAAAKKRVAASFVTSSFNVLGASHTKHSKRFAYGTHRIVWANQILEQHHVDVAGLQEFQAVQYTKFMEITKGAWAAYPGLQKKKLDSENSIIWRTSKFSLVDAATVNIPYFDGHPRAMPVVLLRHKATGALVYFSNFHNPAETAQFHHQQKWRVAASNVEIKLQHQLARTRIARIMTGDMNERADYFCRVTAKASLKAARPGTYRVGGRKTGACKAGKPRAVDWILGSPHATFTAYNEDRSALVYKTTDHPVITSRVTIDPSQLPKSYGATPKHLVPVS